MRRLLLPPLTLFALGLSAGALTPRVVSSAHACKCAGAPIWLLGTPSFEGEGDLEAERAFWQSDARLFADELGSQGTITAGEADLVVWRRMP